MGPLGVYLRGVCMGAADAVPGVSGGTIALITGIYDRLVNAVTAVTVGRVRRLLRALFGRDWATLRATLVEMDAPFLLALGAGVATSVVLVTRVVETAVTEAPVPTFAFFFGLIAASALVLYEDVSLGTPDRAAAAAAGFLVAFSLAGVTGGDGGTGTLAVFVAGAVAVSAMVLPGISGSPLLLLLGQYVYLVSTLESFVDATAALASGGALAPVIDSGSVVAVFVAGALVGLFTVAHAVRYALERRREATLAFLVSLVVGALRAPAAEILAGVSTWDAAAGARVAVPTLAGAAVVLAFDYYAGVSY